MNGGLSRREFLAAAASLPVAAQIASAEFAVAVSPALDVARPSASAREYLARLKARRLSELLDDVVPFWTEHSIDREKGGYLTCLGRDGKPYDTFKQMWMQWREVWMFARLANSPHGGSRFLPYAEQGFDFLFRCGRKKDGGYWYMLDRDGNPTGDSDGGQEVFTESFAAIGCAELYRATGREEYRAEAESAYAIYKEKTRGAEAPSIEFPARRTYVQLAYPMIELNVLQVMRAAFGGRAEGIADAVRRIRRFRNPESGLVFERAPAEGGFDLETQRGRFVNPGHALEGCAFLQRELREKPDPDLGRFVLDVTRRMLEWGWDDEQGGIRYRTDALGLPLAENDAPLKAWWPQAEAMTAALGAYELSGDEWFLDFFRRIDEYCDAHLRDKGRSEWFAYAKIDGRQFHSYKGSRFKGFFHVPRHLLDTVEAVERIERNGVTTL